MSQSRIRQLVERLKDAPNGMHDIGEPGYLMDSALPKNLRQCLLEMDGAELFFEAIVLFAAKDIKKQKELWLVGHYNNDILANEKGVIFSRNEDCLVQEAGSLESFLYGAVEAESTLYGKDGEFVEGLFDEEGELLSQWAVKYEKQKLKRDKKALGPMWRIANLYIAENKENEAQELLEQCVNIQPDFFWAWHDLSVISSKKKRYELALEEIQEAIGCLQLDALKSYFHSKAAYYAWKHGDEEARAMHAKNTLSHDPHFVDHQIELIQGQESFETAESVIEILKAVAPRNLAAIDFIKKHEGAV